MDIYKLSVKTVDGKSEWFVNCRQSTEILELFIDLHLDSVYDKNSIQLVEVDIGQVPHGSTIYNIAFF
jgi:hypothetical protein